MKKFFLPFISFIFLIAIILVVIWFNLPNIFAHFLTKDFGVSVSIENILLKKNQVDIKNFDISNPKKYKTKKAFFIKNLNIGYNFKELIGETLVIDSITFNDIFIGVEFYDSSGNENNWKEIMNMPPHSKNNKKKYLIKKMSLNNISVKLTKNNGKTETFPTIDNLTFYNISDESGFPIDEIEKAIAHAVLKSIFEKFSLNHILDTINPKNIIKSLPIPFTK